MWCRSPLTIFLLALLTGCATLAPDYRQPTAPVPSTWPDGPAYGRGSDLPGDAVTADLAWQEFFVEPQLQKIITLALENNRDLRIALLNMERSRNLFRISRAELMPKIDGNASGSIQRVPEDLTSTGRSGINRLFSVGLGISSYELDLFGRIRSLKDQALEQYLATEQARDSVQISLVADIAGTYLTLAADRERQELANETLDNQQAAYRLVKSRFDAGVASALELYQAQTSVDSARVEIARYSSLVAQDENVLNLLVGAQLDPDLFPTRLSESLTALRDLKPGLPSEVLLGRPDILQAEYELKGANANIGAARAAFFPRIILVSSLGTGSDELSGLFSDGSLTWSFVPRLTLPIFNAGSNRARLEVAKLDKELALASYERAIQSAFREVADALAERGTIDDQVSAQQSLTDATAESYRLSTARYEKGVESYLNVLVSERALYTAQQNLISTRLARLVNLIALYKVLGGGLG